MRTWLQGIGLASSLLLLLGGRAEAGVEALWTTSDGDKVRPEQRPPQTLASSVELFGMRNETLAFQVVVRTDDEATTELSLSLPSLGDVEMQVYRVDNVEVRERSHDLVWHPEGAGKPEGLLGMIPDRLVPLDAPVIAKAQSNQVFWIDVWIPPSASAGIFTGVLQLKNSGPCRQGCELAIELEVLDRQMPDTSHTRTMLWFSAGEIHDDRSVLARYFPDASKASDEQKLALRRAHYHMAKKHRITLFTSNDDLRTKELDDLMSGQAFSEAAGYRGPGQSLGQDLLVLHAYGGELTEAQASEWLRYAEGFNDLVDRFVYVMDEPIASEFEELNRRTQASKPMPAFVTTVYDQTVDADIYSAPAHLYSRDNASKGQRAGKRVWIYNGYRPATGSFAIDDVAISTRVNPWIQYKLGIERWGYWEATYYWDFQGNRGAVDVAKDAMNFSNRQGDRVNGDGLLMYPGRDHVFPDGDVGIDGPLASIRLKNWRRGIEDVEYLVMAREAGFGQEVDALLEQLLPRVVDDAAITDSVSWPEDGESWLQARRYLFELLRDGKSSIVPSQLARPFSISDLYRRYQLWGALGVGLLLGMLLVVLRKRSRPSPIKQKH